MISLTTCYRSFVGRPSRKGGRERGQATVEFALVLPVLIAVLWLGVESVLLVRDQVLVTHAAREAARVAAVGGSPADASSAAAQRSGLSDQAGLVVNIANMGGLAEVTVTLDEAPRLPIIGRLVPNLSVSSTVAMRVESPG